MPPHRSLVLLSLLPLFLFAIPCSAGRSQSDLLRGEFIIQQANGRGTNTFRVRDAMGAGLDGHELGDTHKIYTPENIQKMKSSGLKPISYRLRTELGGEVWHWNPRGEWSDPGRKQGYWVSSDQPGSSIEQSYGYSLPRRGNSTDQADNSGYSRLDDGDLNSFWKSNPYLDSHYTRELPRAHPQWVVIDLGSRQPVNALEIHWANPYALEYQVEYRQNDGPSLIFGPGVDQWMPFPNGTQRSVSGGLELRKLCDAPIKVRWIRILLLESSHTAPEGSRDIRDSLGFAIRELQAGSLDRQGKLKDFIRHSRSHHKQSEMFVSSTDPWHRAIDLDRNTEQPGLDLLFRCGITQGLPVLIPVGLVYDTPENALSELRYLRRRGYPVREIELGEEPDGQYIQPEDYAALYTQWAQAIHQLAPKLRCGGPGFQTDIVGWRHWPDATGGNSWMRRFLKTITARGLRSEFQFFSFEWYPFDSVDKNNAGQLLIAPTLLRNALDRLKQEGVPTDIPWIITEFGYSAFAGQAEVDLPGAILNAEIVAQFLQWGGTATYLYGYEPNTPILEREQARTWGNMMLFVADDEGSAKYPTPLYYAAKLLSQRWADPSDRLCRLFPVRSSLPGPSGKPPVTAYALRRSDGSWAMLLLNKSAKQTAELRLSVQAKGGKKRPFEAGAKIWQYSRKQYHWTPAGEKSYPDKTLPPEQRTLSRRGELLRLPPWSITVIQGRTVGE